LKKNLKKCIKEVSLCDFMIREVGNPNKSHKYTGNFLNGVNKLFMILESFVFLKTKNDFST
jgi:hypothetical protein